MICANKGARDCKGKQEESARPGNFDLQGTYRRKGAARKGFRFVACQTPLETGSTPMRRHVPVGLAVNTLILARYGHALPRYSTGTGPRANDHRATRVILARQQAVTAGADSRARVRP